MSSGAVFTMRLKDVFESSGGTWDNSTGISVLTGGDIGLDNYPLFTDNQNVIPDHRPILNGKIFDHFINREIAYESIGIWRHAMKRTMNEIMPFFNQMYNSALIEINPLRTTDLHTDNSMTDTQVAEQNSNSNSNSNSAGKARTVNSDTPQNMLSGDEDYASGAVDTNSQNETTGEGTQESNSTTTDNASGQTNIIGYQGAASDLLMRFRESFINVDMMIINSPQIEELFMGVWDNGDAFTNNPSYNYFGGY